MAKGVSIIVCCYNSSKRLGETLFNLSEQTCNCNWEIILVDNASTDSTKNLAEEEFKKYAKKLLFTVTEEAKPGKQYALDKALILSKFDYVIICDDDNLLHKSYVQIVFDLFESQKSTGIIGGCGFPKLEIEAPFWFEKFVHSYAVCAQGNESSFVNSVFGAGMAFRKELYMKIKKVGYNFFFIGRTGSSLSAGEDAELSYQYRLLGYKIWYDERLLFQHVIPKSRLNWDYLRKLHSGFAHNYVVLDLYEKAINEDIKAISYFYWFKKAFYYLGIYIKYLPNHYKVFKKGIGSVEEIRHLTWRTIGLDYLKYNFKTIGYYNRILSLKKQLNGE